MPEPLCLEDLADLILSRVQNRLQQKWRGQMFRCVGPLTRSTRAPLSLFCEITGWALNYRDTKDMTGMLLERVFKDLHERATCTRDWPGRAVRTGTIYRRRMVFEICIDREGLS